MIDNIFLLAAVGIAVGAAAGFLGSFMVLKRMSLVGDALSHVALPGIAIALMLNFPPMAGAFIALTLAVIGVWLLERQTKIYPEALIGIFFTTSLAIGILITPEPELLEALFGDIQKITLIESLLAIAISLVLILITTLISKKLVLGIVSPELAQASGINLNPVNLIYLFLVGTIVALGIKFVGTLLTGALVIIPAVSAKNISKSLMSYVLVSTLFGIFSAAFGVIAAAYFHLPPGPVTVLTSAAIFLLTYLVKFAI